MKFTYIVIFMMFLAITLISAAVLAQDTDVDQNKRNDFNARLDHINCRINLVKKQIDLLSGVDTSLSSYKSLLDTDYSKLQELASSFKVKEFSEYFTNTFKDNFMNAFKAIQAAKLNIRKSNLTMEEKISLRDNHKTAIAEFATCINQADKNLADKRAKYLDAWINRWNNVISKMKEKGFDTSEMEAVVAEAQDKLKPALESVRDSTKDTRKTVMENARALHLHLWAKFEIARVRSYLKSIENDAIAKGYQSEVDAIKAKLDQASNTAVKGKRYKEGEFESVWKLIKDATQMLKELNRKL